MAITLTPQPLTRAAFAPFGDVIETPGAPHFAINAGFAERFHDLARIDVATQGGRPLLSIFRAQPRAKPLRLTLMERHPLASQAFFPLQPHDWIVVVAEGPDPCQPRGLRAFRAGGRQGVNYARGTWHHPLIVLTPDHEFLVIDRGDEGANLDDNAVSGHDRGRARSVRGQPALHLSTSLPRLTPQSRAAGRGTPPLDARLGGRA